MRILLQRVTRASVSIGGVEVGAIGPGLVVFVAIANGDSEEDARYLVEKTLKLRLFSTNDRFELSIEEVKGELLIVSQFTLVAETRKGRRPSFTRAAPPQEAEDLFNYFAQLCIARGRRVVTGRFREHMLVSLDNDGPVTILIDSNERFLPRT